jgi:2-haloacid dehalogenase
MKTAFVARPNEHGQKQSRDFKAEHDFTVVADSFVDLADKMGLSGRTGALPLS